ncbi:unnamed protein product [Polarella glacialis]|nr:unnamed protein product [Polarella glacialis]
MVLWRRLDIDGSGEVSLEEFTILMYRVDLASWPEASSPDDIDRVIRRLNAAVEKWHHAGGNWYRMFLHIETTSSGHITFDNLKRFVRGRFLGLNLDLSEMPDDDLRKLWKAMDSSGDMRVPIGLFMAFMRRNGTSVSMHKVTISAAPAMSRQELREVATRLALLLHSWLGQRGIRGPNAAAAVTSPAVWSHLFNFIDADGSGRLTFLEFEGCALDVLKSGSKVSGDELKGLWRAVDVDGSGEATAEEFAVALYRLQIETWPRLGDDALAKLIGLLNAAADKWHRCGGNWYKVLVLCDEDGMHYFPM